MVGNKYKNPIKWGGPFEITAESPIDSRMVVTSEADLYQRETWYPEDGIQTPVYKGMTVTVLDKACLYILLDEEDYQNPESWHSVCGGGGTGPGIVGCGCQGYQGSGSVRPDCCVCVDSYVDADTGEVLLEGGCIDDVIERLLARIIDLEDKLSKAVTKIEPLDDDSDIQIEEEPNPNSDGCKTVKLKVLGINN